ncbi:trypsin-like peptidase domain-containing protein [Paenibacillus sp. SGZ-1009]|uniref:trypsin-like peptidase domain-containing protein n=1 Tax=Paenibacillus campi TaxID=3106031 RepID=UPI002AFFCDB1|nr:trypsin-like peptidase domain-containing protein [Paenibacillus sp. SGZ-1009]
MALFDDDFYSTKVSRHSKRHVMADERNSSFRSVYEPVRRGMSTVRVVMISALTSAVTISAIMGGLFLYHDHYSGAATASGMLPTQQTSGNPYESIVQVAQQVRPAVVSIVNYKDDNKPEMSTLDESALGSGVIFRKTDGKAYIVTNNHVISGADEVDAVLTDGTMLKANVIGSDFISDIAVLSVDGKHIDHTVALGNSDQLRPGETVLAIGNPLGFNGTMTSGIVSYDHRLIPVSLNQDGNYDWEQNVIQTDAAINEGNSGGALVNMRGQLIGINTMKISDTGVEGLGFAIPINEVMRNVQQLLDHGKINRPYLGVYSIDLDNESAYRSYDAEANSDAPKLRLPDDVTKGAVVLEVSGPAKDAGLKVNDVIVQLDGQTIGSTLELRKYLYDKKQIGNSIKITYYRDGQKQTATTTLLDTPERK